MAHKTNRHFRRREFLASVAATGLGLGTRTGYSATGKAELKAGQGIVDTTPPLGIELAGFHKAPGKERRITGIRRPSAARALVVGVGADRAAIVSLDICAVSRQMSGRVQQAVAKRTGIPAANVRLCATHTHAMPTLRYFRQWGAVSPEYMASVEKKIVQAVELAVADSAAAELYVGTGRAPGASNNRTTKTWKTDEQFGKDSSDADRWLDTTVQVAHFQRPGENRNLLWYHFSAHPVCYRDGNAGPDWPGLVDELVREKLKIRPSFLQGHCGDVNAGDTKNWIGSAENTANPVFAAIETALAGSKRVKVDGLRVQTEQFKLPLNIELFKQWLAAYKKDPAKPGGGFVDARFAADWFESSAKYDLSRTYLPIPLTAMRIGELGLVFHPSELYSYYGLAIRRDSPLPNTLVVGYTDDIIGYLPDPNAHKAKEYSADVVPKILDLPPFTPTATRDVAAGAVALLKKTVG